MVIAFWIMLIAGASALIPTYTILIQCDRKGTPLPPFVREHWVPILVVGTMLISLALCAAIDIIGRMIWN